MPLVRIPSSYAFAIVNFEMVTREAIVEQFDNFGIKIEDEVINKCLDLCDVHQIRDAVLLVEHWLAYSLSNLDGVQPTIQTLAEMGKNLRNDDELTISTLPNQNLKNILCTFGDADLVKKTKWSSNKMQNIIVKQKLGENFTPDTKYMFDNVNGKCKLLKQSLLAMDQEFRKKIYGDNCVNSNFQNVSTPSQESIKTIGRIATDCDTKLDIGSAVLIGPDETVYRTVRLNFSKMDSFAVFPGQVVMVTGKNPRGDTIHVEHIKSEGILKRPISPNLKDPLNFLISAGPYTCHNDLAYDPFQDLLNYCKENTPDVIILCGPFIQADHTLVEKNTLAEPIDEFFENILQKFADNVGCQTTVCIVPSAKDIISVPVYPTSPITLQKTPKNVHLLSDPSILDINSVLVGITSIDVLDHITREEFSSKAGDKIKRCVNHLFQQKSFYPLLPAPINSNIDSELLKEFGILDIIPNIIILPSNLKYFIREVNSCLAINPGRITGRNGGTFARLTINPPKGADKLFDFMACQILKI